MSEKKIKVLWIAFQPIPAILKKINPDMQIVTGGWLQGAADIITKHDDIELSYCFQFEHDVEGVAEEMYYFSMPVTPVVKRRDIVQYKKEDFIRFKSQIEKIKPDIIHIYGTETWFQRQFAFMVKELGLIDKTVVWIQGLTSFCANAYCNGLSQREINRKTVWEAIRGTNIYGIKNRLRLNGEGEFRELEILKHVFVRTEWDTACCRAVNSKLTMHYCGETLRPEFYQDKVWSVENLKKHRIFFSQCNTPIKGFHQMLKAMPIILKEFPDAELCTTGFDLMRHSTNFMNKLREPSYNKILREMISEYGLKTNVKFLGKLSGEEMRNQYADSSVFVMASTIENSPNSIGEAMMVGVPIVASDVGGVSSMLTHKYDGLLYPFNEYAILAEEVCRLFREADLAVKYSVHARKKALHTHSQEGNYEMLLNGYREIMEG